MRTKIAIACAVLVLTTGCMTAPTGTGEYSKKHTGQTWVDIRGSNNVSVTIHEWTDERLDAQDNQSDGADLDLQGDPALELDMMP